MTIGEQVGAGTAERRGVMPRPRFGALSAVALVLAPVLVLIGFEPGAWHLAALGWLGVALLAGATLTAYRMRWMLTDEMTGRGSLALRLGDAGSRVLYVTLAAGAYLVVAGLAALAPWTAIALVTALPLVVPVWRVRSGAVSGQLDPVVRDTALVCLNYGALIGLALALG